MQRLSVRLLILNLVTLVTTLVMNWLANALPLNGRTTGQISDAFSANVFAPAGYVFAIWGVIYLGLIAFAAYQFTPAGRLSPAVRLVGGWFALSNIANALWIVFWHYEIFPATMAAMLVLLVSLCAIIARLRIPPSAASPGDRWLVYLPFSVYLGWISVATIANASIFLLDLGWDGSPMSSPIWGLLLIGMATGLGAWMVLRRGDLAYAAVLVWAFVGIAVKQEGVALMPLGAWSGVGVLLALVGWRTLRGRLIAPHGLPPACPVSARGSAGSERRIISAELHTLAVLFPSCARPRSSRHLLATG
jgi:benzodiazapine receptor